MKFTTTTKIARNGKKEFDAGIKIVMCNNEDIGLIWGKDYYDFFKDGTIIEELRQEMREAKDKTTSSMVEQYNSGTTSTDSSVTFHEFKQKYV